MMINIEYRDCHETADFAGHSVKEAREAFKTRLAIPDNARARLNGRNIKCRSEPQVMLDDDDELFLQEQVGGESSWD